MVLERNFQAGLIKRLRDMFPGIIILKNDEQYLTGIPDLTLLWQDRWALLEVKKSANAPFEPLQEHYLNKADQMSFARMICPENETDVLNDLTFSWGL